MMLRWIVLACVGTWVWGIHANCGAAPPANDDQQVVTRTSRFAPPTAFPPTVEPVEDAEPPRRGFTLPRPRLPRLPNWLQPDRGQTDEGVKSLDGPVRRPESMTGGLDPAATIAGGLATTTAAEAIAPPRKPLRPATPHLFVRPRRPPPDPAPKPDQESAHRAQSVAAIPSSDETLDRTATPQDSSEASGDVVGRWVAKRTASNAPDQPVSASGEEQQTRAAEPAAASENARPTASDLSQARSAGTTNSEQDPPIRPLPSVAAAPPATPPTTTTSREKPARLPLVTAPSSSATARPVGEPAMAPLAPVVPASAAQTRPSGDMARLPVASLADTPSQHAEGSWLATYERLVREAGQKPADSAPAGSVKRSLRSSR